jgi:ubiquinone/menaquinone biosynthesis C-methylase UbiE
MRLSVDYVCPMCISVLDLINTSFFCTKCNIKYEIRDGIPIFSLDKNYYFNPIPREIMEVCLKIIDSHGWEDGFKEILKHIPTSSRREWRENVLNDSRAAWIFLLDIPYDGTVLDLGCGWGSISINLAKYYKKVIAFDLSIERIQFMKKRVEEIGLDNLIFVCGGDSPRLPFPSEYFDTVILNGVLEWIPTNQKGNPQKVQVQFLREIYRVLKNSKQLYIGIENRYGYEYFLGKPDNHSRLLCGSLLPRTIANYYSLLRKGTEYRTYTYSLDGYKKILKKAGFEKTCFYSLIPNYREFDRIVDLSSKNQIMLKEFAKYKKSKFKKLFFRSRLYKYLSPSYGIVSSKNIKETKFIDNLLVEISKKLFTGKENLLILREYILSKKNLVILKTKHLDNNMTFLVKIPLNEITLGHIKNHFRILSDIYNNNKIPDYLKKYIPPPLFLGEYRKVPYFVEKEISGVSIDTSSFTLPEIDILTREAAFFIINFHSITSSFTFIDNNMYKELFHKYILLTRSLDGSKWIKKILLKIDSYLRDIFVGEKIPIVWGKGDFSLSNMIADPENKLLTGIIDWDLSTRNSLPLLDLINLLDSKNRLIKKINLGESLIEAFLKYNIPDEDQKLIYKYNDSLSISDKFIKPFCIINWLDHICDLNEYYIRLNDEWMEKNFYRVIDFLDGWLPISPKIAIDF